jgi:hypothetical protein
MKKAAFLIIALLTAILSVDVPAHAQLPAGYVEIQPVNHGPVLFRMRPGTDCYIRGDGIYDEEKLKPLLANPKCAEFLRALNIDHKTQTLIRYSARGDCHMRLRTKIFRSDTDKKYLLIINNVYGGCRAGGSREEWMVIDKIPEGYGLNISEVRVDRIHGVNADGEDFYFPKQPSGIKPELIESREIDVKGCLPLDRQSQWIIMKDEFLQSALEVRSRECKELFAVLAIDFDKYTLAGYNVNTGDCMRPPSLSQKVYKDFDEKRYRMEISYDKPAARCEELTWHALWVIVPKLPGDHGFQFELKPNDAKK